MLWNRRFGKRSPVGGDESLLGGDDSLPGGDESLPGGDQSLPGGDRVPPRRGWSPSKEGISPSQEGINPSQEWTVPSTGGADSLPSPKASFPSAADCPRSRDEVNDGAAQFARCEEPVGGLGFRPDSGGPRGSGGLTPSVTVWAVHRRKFNNKFGEGGAPVSKARSPAGCGSRPSFRVLLFVPQPPCLLPAALFKGRGRPPRSAGAAIPGCGAGRDGRQASCQWSADFRGQFAGVERLAVVRSTWAWA